jgi:phosphomevalonate kinase
MSAPRGTAPALRGGASSGILRASAPGKMMIAGEYAVLEGAEAVVAAVDRRVLVTLDPAGAAHPSGQSLEVRQTRALIEARFGAITGELAVDASATQQGGKKLGVGSSAAKAAATAGVLLRALGHDLTQAATRALALELALEGHRAVSAQGSGADVAASVLGGFVRFRRLGEGVETHPIAWPKVLQSVVVWTGAQGVPADTSTFVASVHALAVRNPQLYRAKIAAVAGESERFVSALMAADISEIIECFHALGTALGSLGEEAGIAIVDASTDTVRRLAQENGGAAKPSGAGGGDVALALFSSEEGADAFRAGCVREGFEVLSMELGVPGERDEEQS